MRMIIDIPIGKYNEIVFNDEDVSKLRECIINAIPLSDIIQKIELEKMGYPPSSGYYRAINKVMQIINSNAPDNTLEKKRGGIK